MKRTLVIVGLGLIGGSLALALKGFEDFEIVGVGVSQPTLRDAAEHGVGDRFTEKAADVVPKADVVALALHPQGIVDFLAQYREQFKPGALVWAVCGIKTAILAAAVVLPDTVDFIGCHPMAGKEVSGIENACADLFDRANMVLTRGIFTDAAAYETIVKLVKDMGFMRLVECSAEVHDRKIAYTSQLAHIVSNAYVKDAELESCLGFTGGSFQDMTRIAAVDPGVWAELYLSNAQNVQDKVQRLIDNLEDIKDAVASGDYDTLVRVLGEGRARYSDSRAQSFQKEGTGFLDGEIIATLLHD